MATAAAAPVSALFIALILLVNVSTIVRSAVGSEPKGAVSIDRINQ
jgi:hypothetical protein